MLSQQGAVGVIGVESSIAQEGRVMQVRVRVIEIPKDREQRL